MNTSGSLAKSELVLYCTCESCSEGSDSPGPKGSCELNDTFFEHLQTVATIVATGSQQMLSIGYKVGQEEDHVTCHASLLCYWSPVIRRALARSRKPVRMIWLNFEETGAGAIIVWRQIVQWCYVGRLMDPSDVSDATIGSSDDLEVLWSAAVMLEMNELANYCMRLVFVKYTWGLSARATTSVACSPRDCPYDALGPYQVFRSARRGGWFHKLLWFMEDLISARGPLTPGAVAHATEQAVHSWDLHMGFDGGFREWIDRLGGLTHDNHVPVLPTHFSRWNRYFVPLETRTPENVLDWVFQHKDIVELQGKPVALVGSWERRAHIPTEFYQWVFREVQQQPPPAYVA